jgi:hypothetical protein
MPLRENNTYHYLPYEREYLRYGGEAGVELAEWHFEHSSDTVLALLATTNTHVRTVLLGQSVQLGLILCFAMLGDDRRVAEFLLRYRDYWERTHHIDRARHATYDSLYRRMADRLGRRVDQIRSGVDDERQEPAGLTALEQGWLRGCRELRERLVGLTVAGKIVVPGHDVPDTPGDTTVDGVLVALLGSYLHMTNNRLGVSSVDEAYLAHVLWAALRDAPSRG